MADDLQHPILRESSEGDCHHCDVWPASLRVHSCEPNLLL